MTPQFVNINYAGGPPQFVAIQEIIVIAQQESNTLVLCKNGLRLSGTGKAQVIMKAIQLIIHNVPPFGAELNTDWPNGSGPYEIQESDYTYSS